MSNRTRDLKYFDHYHKHTYYVVLAWKAICIELWNRNMLTESEFEKTTKLIAWHDQSKMDKSEWEPYAEKFFGNSSKEEVKDAFKAAKREHKAKNLHHYESLKDYEGDDWKCYVVELVCDYIAMGWEFDNYILEYYDSVKESIELPSEYKDFLVSILDMLKEPELFEIVEKPLTPQKAAELDFLDIILEPKNTFNK